MSLRKTIEIEGKSSIESPFGLIDTGIKKFSTNALCKVVFVQGGKESVNITVSFSDNDVQYSRQYSFTPSVDSNSKNFIAQAYEHLKTLPEFAGATDC